MLTDALVYTGNLEDLEKVGFVKVEQNGHVFYQADQGPPTEAVIITEEKIIVCYGEAVVITLSALYPLIRAGLIGVETVIDTDYEKKDLGRKDEKDPEDTN